MRNPCPLTPCWRVPAILGACLLTTSPVLLADGDGVAALCADRLAVERVYHRHRTGTKLPFEQAMPPEMVGKLVRADQKKEAVLERVYQLKVTPEMVAEEWKRIEDTTRSRETLDEIKAALGNDPKKIAATFVRPIVVERLLHDKFDNDEALHAPRRKVAEEARALALAEPKRDPAARLAILQAAPEGEAKPEVTWSLLEKPAEKPASVPMVAPTPVESKSGAYTNQATARVAPDGAPPAENRPEHRLYITDLPPDLRKVLLVQLVRPGDVSAVIDGPGAFQVFLARERTAQALTASVLSIRKQTYEAWLNDQPAPQIP